MEIGFELLWSYTYSGPNLIVEDGTIVPNANTFVNVDEARAYASARNITLPTNDADVATFLIRAADFLRTLESRFAGYRVDVSQALPYPRKCAPVPNMPRWYYDTDEIPDILKQGQIELMVALSSGVNLYGSAASSAARSVKRRKVGPIETEYFEASGGASSSLIGWAAVAPAAYAVLSPLFGAGFGALTSVRG